MATPIWARNGRETTAGSIGRPRLAILPHWLRNPAGAIMLAAAFFGLLGTVTVLLEIGHPFPRVMTYSLIGQTWVEIAHETPAWWAPLADGTLQNGDIFLTVNGLPYVANARQELARAYEAGQPARLEVRRLNDDQPFFIDLPLFRFSPGEFLDVKLPELLVGLVTWFLAAIVLRARPDSATNRVFAALASLVALHRLTAITSIFGDDLLLVNLPKVGHMIAAGLIGPMLLHLVLLFPIPLRQPRRLLAVTYVLGLLSGLILALSRLPLAARLPDRPRFTVEEIAFQTMLYLLLAGIIALFGRLLWSLKRWRSVSRRERRIVRIVLSGLVLSMPPVLVVLAPIVPGWVQIRSAFALGVDLRYLMLAVPIAFAIAIVRYQTFQSPSKLFIFLIALAISAMLAAVGTAIWLAMIPPALAASLRPPFVVMFVFILAGSVFWSRQADWRGWFGRFLHRADRNYESARAFGDRVMGGHDMRALPATIARALVDELELERAAIWLWSPVVGGLELAAAAGGEAPPLPAHVSLPEGQLALAQPLHVAWAATPPWLSGPMAMAQIEVVVPLVAEGQPIGLLGLGRRWDEEIFDDRDLAIAELVGQQTTLFVLAATQVEELRRVPERVAEAQERERYRLAGELHDTIQQLLGRLPFYLTVSRDMMARDRDGAAALLDRCIADVGEAAGVLREIRANLAPNQLETSLVKPLEMLAAHMTRQTGLAVRLSLAQDLDQATTAGTRHALYRVIQQALDNTVAHAEASEVVVTAARSNGRVTFAVVDNGVGSTPAARREALAQGSFGMQSMRARLEAVGGAFEFDSVDGQGTRVSGWVPAATERP